MLLRLELVWEMLLLNTMDKLQEVELELHKQVEHLMEL